MGNVRRGNPVLAVIIVVTFLGLSVFLLVSRKSQTGTSQQQSTTQNQ
jgi:hypothetical protein